MKSMVFTTWMANKIRAESQKKLEECPKCERDILLKKSCELELKVKI